MTTTTRPIAYFAAPLLLLATALLAAGNWYLSPERSAAWGSALALVAVMTLALIFAAARSVNGGARRRAADAIVSGVVFAGVMLALSLSTPLIAASGAAGGADLSRRATMIIMGIYFVFVGNALPKTLTPLSALQCDGSRVQAFQRFAGWTWVLTGLAYALAWMTLPIDLAEPASTVMLFGGMLTVATQLVWLKRSHRREA